MHANGQAAKCRNAQPASGGIEVAFPDTAWSPDAVVEGWLDSDGHCRNIMSPDFTEIGVGYHPGDTEARFGQDQHYWTQNFGAPRGQGGFGGDFGGFGGFDD